MEAEFFFVDSARTDREVRRQMRRHVMKGKNAGKKFHRPSRLDLAPTRTTARRCALELAAKAGNGVRTQVACASSISSKISNGWHTFGIPTDASPAALQTIDEFFSLTVSRMYPVLLGLSMDDAKFVWLQVLVQDNSTYQCTLATMENCNEIYLGRRNISPKALSSLSKLVCEIQKRLETAEALSDSTIIIVVALIYQMQIQKHQSSARIHLEGLKQMIDLRGGVRQLEGNRALLLKVCKTDVLFALAYGGATRFYRDEMFEVYETLFPPKVLSQVPMVPPGLTSPLLQSVFIDLVAVSELFNSIGPRQPVDVLIFQELLMSLFYRLIRFHPLDDTGMISVMDSAHHIGMLTFTMTLFITFEKQRILDCTVISTYQMDTVNRLLNGAESELAFWVLMMIGIWSSAVDGDWIIPGLRAVAEKLAIKSWDQVHDFMAVWPWIDILHNSPGRELWNRIHESSISYV